MKEIQGVNMWDIAADAYCITTNGIIKKNGCAVMGAGVALSVAKTFPGCDKFLGHFIKNEGHKVGVFLPVILKSKTVDLISFPTKYHWKDESDIKLIEKSTKELIDLVNKKYYNKVILPRPGCANGGLEWDDVKKVITPILDDRIIVVSL